LNRRPADYESAALPTELPRPEVNRPRKSAEAAGREIEFSISLE